MGDKTKTWGGMYRTFLSLVKLSRNLMPMGGVEGGTMKNKIKPIIAGLLAIAVWGLMGLVPAQADDVNLTVDVSNAVSVDIIQTSYNFSTVALGAVTINTVGVQVNNTSGGIRQDYSLSLTDIAETPNNWTSAADGAAAGTDIYNLRALFRATQPPDGDFTNGFAEDQLQTASAAATSTRYFGSGTFANDGGADVLDTAGTSERTLWFRLSMPTVITSGEASHDFATVSVTAVSG